MVFWVMRDFRLVEFSSSHLFRIGWSAQVDRAAGDQLMLVKRLRGGGYILIVSEPAVPVLADVGEEEETE